MKIKWQRFNRKTHYWGAAVCALPILIVLTTGLLLQVKKQLTWVQPSTIKTQSRTPSLNLDEVLIISKTVAQAKIQSWQDINRIDIRPNKGVIKVQSQNHWEIQLNQLSGEVLAVNYRRSDIIEALHDGSFFFDGAKLYLFLPAAFILLWLWISGSYLFVKTFIARKKHQQRLALKASG